MAHPRIALAYSGSPRSSVAVRWLADARGAEVVAITVDVGQADDLEDVRSRALSSGAVRAVVVDRRERFAYDALLPAVTGPGGLDGEALRRLADPIVAQAVVEAAALEKADALACLGSSGVFERHVGRFDPSRRLIAVEREWAAEGAEPSGFARTHRVPLHPVRAERHLLMRPCARRPATGGARVTITFEGGVPVEANGVPMTIVELTEWISLIGGQYGLGEVDGVCAPAAAMLRAAYAGSGGHGPATLELTSGALALVEAPHAELVSHP